MDTLDSTPTRFCRKCAQWLPDTDEYFYQNRGYLCSPCKQCKHVYQNGYAEKNPDKVAVNKKKWQQNNPDKVYAASRRSIAKKLTQYKAYAAKYYQEHKSVYRERGKKWYSAHPERARELDKRWRQKHPDKVRAKFARRRHAPGSHTAKDIRVQYKMQKGNCWWCGQPVGDDYHVDHLLPLSRGGTNNPENLVISCAHCNTSRADRLPSEWSNRLL